MFDKHLQYRQGKITKLDCLFPTWEEVGPINIHSAGLFTDIKEFGKRELNESINIMIGWVAKYALTTIIPPLFARNESLIVMAKHFSFYIALNSIIDNAAAKRLIEYHLETTKTPSTKYVGFEMLNIAPGEDVPEEKKLYLINPGNIYKNSLAPEDKWDYANLKPEYTEPLENFPSVVKIRRLADHWRAYDLTGTAGSMRARQINRIINPVRHCRTYLSGLRPEHLPSQFYKQEYQLETKPRNEHPTLPKVEI